MPAPESATDVLKRAVALRKHGAAADGLTLLQESLRSGVFNAEQIGRAGRFIQVEIVRSGDDANVFSVVVLGQCTTSWIVPALAATAWARRCRLRVADGEYDHILQDIVALQAAPDRPDVIVLVPWTKNLLGSSGRSKSQRLDDELAFWRQAWRTTAASGSRFIQIGYDWTNAGPLGSHLGGSRGDIRLIREMNTALRRHLPSGAFFVDLEQLSGEQGRSSFYDARRYFWTKQPFSEAGTVRLAEHLFAGVRALTTGPKKVLVLDLDNTLWGGVVGETGPLQIALGESPDGEAYRAFQKHIKGLGTRGIVLAVASKNNPDDAREPFEKNPDMVLALDDFAAFEANWNPKAASISGIANTLNLGLDSFVFFDDNPAEREHIRQLLPDVEVVDVPEDPADYIAALERGLWFETVQLTTEDADRTQRYAVERQRRDVETTFASMEDYLRSLDMRGDVREIDDTDMLRVVQLLGKTNQFNLTTRRHTEENVRAILAQEGAMALTLRVSDRFGDHGLVSVMLGVPLDGAPEAAVRIDTWLMSCRVIGRTVEQAFFGAFSDRARTLGYKKIVGEFIPTKKNAVAAGIYTELGFDQLDRGGDLIRYQLSLDSAKRPRSWVVRVT